MKGRNECHLKNILFEFLRQFRTKRVQHFSRDGSKITYVQDQLYIFDEEASAPLRESDNIVVLNMHMNVRKM